MKLRIRLNTVRIRLTHGEVDQLADGQPVSQTTEFSPASRLACIVEPRGDISSPRAEFAEGRLAIFIPKSAIAAWAGSETVGIESTQPIAGGRSLSILIEKDFECLHSRGELIEDTYPNPRAASANK